MTNYHLEHETSLHQFPITVDSLSDHHHLCRLCRHRRRRRRQRRRRRRRRPRKPL